MKSHQLASRQRNALSLYVKLMRATNSTTTSIHRHLQADQLTHSQFAVLEALYHLGAMSQGELGEKILKSNANLTTVVDSLEKKALVLRQRSTTDRRRVSVELTDTGEELIARVFPRHVQVVTQVLGHLDADEQQQLEMLLKKLGRGG